jgi:ribose 5-phosphate isomerase B
VHGSARKIITAAELPESGEFLIPYDAVLTPLARDEAEKRGLTIREVRAEDAVPKAPAEKTVALASDHGGFQLKERLKPLLEQLGLAYEDFGVYDEQPADYPDQALLVAEAVAGGRAARGIIVDGAGIGSAMAANKVPGVRAALCYDKASARNSREHNNANVLTLGGRLLAVETALEVAATWLTTAFAGGRHEKRVAKIAAIERRYQRS